MLCGLAVETLILDSFVLGFHFNNAASATNRTPFTCASFQIDG